MCPVGPAPDHVAISRQQLTDTAPNGSLMISQQASATPQPPHSAVVQATQPNVLQQIQAALPRQPPAFDAAPAARETPQQPSRSLQQGPVQTSPALQQQYALPKDLLERLNGSASQDDLQSLRDQLEEALEELHDISRQMEALQGAQIIAASPIEGSSLQADDNIAQSRTQGRMAPASASAESPIFLPLLNEQAPSLLVPRGEQVQLWQQQEMSSPRVPKQRQITNTPVQSDAGMVAPARQTASVQIKAMTIDRASSAAPGWEMNNNISASSQVTTQGQEAGLQTQSGMENVLASQQQQQQQSDQLPQNQSRSQGPTNTRSRVNQMQKQGASQQQQKHQQQQQQQQQLSSRLEPSMAPGDILQPVILGTQALTMDGTDLNQEAGKQIPATVQIVAQSESGIQNDGSYGSAVANLRASASSNNQASARSAQGNLDRIPEAMISLPRQQGDVADNLPRMELGQTLVVGQGPGLVQAAWIQRPRTGASGGSAGEAQESLTVDQLAASLQTVAGVVHAMALGPPSQVTSANSVVRSS